MLTSSRSTLIDTPRNIILQDIWASLSPVKLTHAITHYSSEDEEQGRSTGFIGDYKGYKMEDGPVNLLGKCKITEKCPRFPRGEGA
jgi:hypothetical protein